MVAVLVVLIKTVHLKALECRRKTRSLLDMELGHLYVMSSSFLEKILTSPEMQTGQQDSSKLQDTIPSCHGTSFKGTNELCQPLIFRTRTGDAACICHHASRCPSKLYNLGKAWQIAVPARSSGANAS